MRERSAASVESLDAAGNGVRVEFGWVKDRYQHTVFSISSGSAKPAFVSDDSETAPSLVDLHWHGETVLLTGANSSGHWSLSVLRNADSTGGIVFDLACRSRLETDAFEIAYELASAANSIFVEGLDADGAGLSLIATSKSGQLTIASAQVSTTSAPRTFRWRYRVVSSD